MGRVPAAPEEEAGPASGVSERTPLVLFDYDNIQVRPAPSSTFLGRTIALTEGFARTQDIEFGRKTSA